MSQDNFLGGKSCCKACWEPKGLSFPIQLMALLPSDFAAVQILLLVPEKAAQVPWNEGGGSVPSHHYPLSEHCLVLAVPKESCLARPRDRGCGGHVSCSPGLPSKAAFDLALPPLAHSQGLPFCSPPTGRAAEGQSGEAPLHGPAAWLPHSPPLLRQHRSSARH